MDLPLARLEVVRIFFLGGCLVEINFGIAFCSFEETVESGVKYQKGFHKVPLLIVVMGKCKNPYSCVNMR